MDGPMSGDIFPAREAIGLIDQVELGVPLEIPPVPPEAEPENVPVEEHRWLLAEIARLKKEKNAYVLAHNYAPSDIQDVPTPSAIRSIWRRRAPNRMPRSCSKPPCCS